jgi:hypothetical protein
MSTVKSVTTLAIIFAFLSTRRMLAESYRRISAARNCVTFVTMGGEDAPCLFCLSRPRAGTQLNVPPGWLYSLVAP